MAIDVFINERRIGVLDPAGATIGEMVDALSVHIEPGHILTTVEVDGTEYSAGDDERYARRGADRVNRLVLTTATPEGFATEMRAEIVAAFNVIIAKLERVIAELAQGGEREANRLLAELFEELRLTLVLEREVSSIDRIASSRVADEVGELASVLIDAQARRDWPELSRLIETRLLPALQREAEAPRAQGGAGMCESQPPAPLNDRRPRDAGGQS